MNITTTYSHSYYETDRLSVRSGIYVECCGEVIMPSVAEVKRLFVKHRVPLEEQPSLWDGLIDAYPSVEWAEQCLDEISHLQRVISRRQSLMHPVACEPQQPSKSVAAHSSPTAHEGSKHEKAPLPMAQSEASAAEVRPSFIWCGEVSSIATSCLCDAISDFAVQTACFSSDIAQQDAFRRAIGYVVHKDEFTSRPSQVVWCAPDNMLNYLIASLFGMGLINCTGGPNYKWRVARRIFIHGDGSPLGSSLRNNVLSDPSMRKLVDRSFLQKVRPLAPRQASA